MFVRQWHRTAMVALILIGLVNVSGCDENERLAKYAQHSVEQQAKQNEQIARQSEAVSSQTQQIAHAAHQMVEADARARQELVAAQRDLNAQLQAERSSLDRQHDELEQQRQRVAESRHRDPVVAAAIQALALLLACLLPLLICVYALRQLDRTRPNDDGLSELLVTALADDESVLLSGRRESPPAIDHRSPAAELPSHPQNGESA